MNIKEEVQYLVSLSLEISFDKWIAGEFCNYIWTHYDDIGAHILFTNKALVSKYILQNEYEKEYKRLNRIIQEAYEKVK